jgi:16S rRNA C967 or C1407 C5-methylase (RsmB/RsmF family)/NOL1/NOP2/fmu family ribosome biogenesis protein
MSALLGPEADDFLASLEEAPRTGLRANTLKLVATALPGLLPWPVQSVPWCAEGLLLEAGEALPGRHPYHAAGLYYLQDPSAMLAGVLLDPQPGEVVLDLCAAPGGKATHLAARLHGQGLLVANDLVRTRTAALVENLERFGAANILVTQAAPEMLAARWTGVFDAVLVDAPCSGEGMFRKTPAARQEWRPAVVEGCALRQAAILDQAAALVRPGGRLLYATCTFAPEEDEGSVARFLHSHPEFTLRPSPALPGLDPSRPDWIAPALAAGLPLERCVRLWPHRSPGGPEYLSGGHFFALMQREGDAPAAILPVAADRLPPAATAAWQAFADPTLKGPLPEQGWAVYGDHLHLLPVSPEFWQGVPVVRAGLAAGRLAPGRFEPDHALALAGIDTTAAATLAVTAAAAGAYLRGETLPATGGDGWVRVTVDGFALGWGKRVQGVVKNHYPRGLRQRG